MLVQLGQRRATGDLVDELVECHGRIRKFLGFGRALASTAGVPREEVHMVAGQIRRYFAVAFPMHRQDEEELIAPVLAEAEAELDAALAKMVHDHADHAAQVVRLVELCADLEREPELLPRHAAELAAIVGDLEAELEPHLQLEEHLIFPALRELPRARRDEILRAMRARRSEVL